VTIDKDYANDIKRQNGGKVYEYTVKSEDLFYPKTVEGFKELPSLNKWGAFQYQSSKTRSQLKAEWDKVGVDDLLSEAKKYKSADEFVKAGDIQGDEYFKIRDSISPKVKKLQTVPTVAKGSGMTERSAEVLRKKILKEYPDAKVVRDRDYGSKGAMDRSEYYKVVSEQESPIKYSDLTESQKKEINKAMSEKFPLFQSAIDEATGVWSMDKLKSQLTEICNKANKTT
jgi:hypothetical protein